MPVSSLTVADICDAINTSLGETLEASGDLINSQNYNELTEGMNDERVLQIYPEEELPVSSESETNYRTLKKSSSTAYVIEDIIIHADYYAKQRSNLGDDMAKLVSGIDAIRDNLKAQVCPFFNEARIRNFRWSWRRVVFDYGGPELKYVGARFRLEIRTF